MNPARMLMYLIGIILVVGALMVFFFEFGLDRWVSVTLLGAGILLIVGLSVMSFADTAPSEHGHRSSGHHDDSHHGTDGDVTIVKK